MARFVTPQTVRLDLSDGDWIEVKERLNLWERDSLSGIAIEGMGVESSREIVAGLTYASFTTRKLETWLVDWSFTDGDDKRVEISQAAIRNLDPDTADEIDEALAAYIAAREELKKVPSGDKA